MFILLDHFLLIQGTISSHTGQHCYSYELLYGVRLFWNLATANEEGSKWCRQSFDEGAFDVLLNLITENNPFVLNARENNEINLDETMCWLQLTTYEKLLVTYEELGTRLDMFFEDEKGTLLIRERKLFEDTSLNLSSYV